MTAFPLASKPIHVPDEVLDDLRARLRADPAAAGRGQRGLVLRRPGRLPRRAGRVLARRLRLAQGRGRDQRLRALPRARRRGAGAFHAQARSRPGPDPADPHPRLAVDVLALVEGDRPARRPGGVRRRPGRRVRRHRAVAARVRVPRAAHRQPGHELLEDGRPLAHADDRDPRLLEVRRRRLRRRRAGHRPARPQVRRRAVRHPHRLRACSSTSSPARARGALRGTDPSPTACPPRSARGSSSWTAVRGPPGRAHARRRHPRARAERLARRFARVDPGALDRVERQRRRRRARVQQGRPAHPRHDLLGDQLDRHLDPLLRQREPLPLDASHDRTPVVEAPTGITFVTYENPPGIHTADERVRAFENGPQAAWYNHVNVTAHDHGGHFIPWENPDAWVADLRRTFRDRRP